MNLKNRQYFDEFKNHKSRMSNLGYIVRRRAMRGYVKRWLGSVCVQDSYRIWTYTATTAPASTYQCLVPTCSSGNSPPHLDKTTMTRPQKPRTTTYHCWTTVTSCCPATGSSGLQEGQGKPLGEDRLTVDASRRVRQEQNRPSRSRRRIEHQAKNDNSLNTALETILTSINQSWTSVYKPFCRVMSVQLALISDLFDLTISTSFCWSLRQVLTRSPSPVAA